MSDSGTPTDGGTQSTPQNSGGSSVGGSTAAAGAGEGEGAGVPPAKHHGFFGSHKALTALAVIFVVLAASAGGYVWWLESQLGSIMRVPADIVTAPERNGSNNEKDHPLNILLLGADHGQEGQSVADDLADGKWTPFLHLSDTIMLVHIPADRDTVQLISIPRDTWTKIDGYPSADHYAKINAAFSYGGPALAVKTVQQLTGIDVDHMAIIDWVGFRDLTTALGGVRVYIPRTFYDDSQRITWHKGWQTLEGEPALQYVRTRHGLENGDFDRIKRQQNFLRSTMGELLSTGTTRNPITLGKVVKVITSNLTVDDSWDNDEIRSLALSLRNIGTADVQFVTAPFGRYDTSSDGQSIVRLAPKQSKALFQAVKDDEISSYLDKYPDQGLGDKRSIN